MDQFYKLFFLPAILSFLPWLVNAQEHDPDTLLLPAVEIRGSLPPALMGIREAKIDTLSMQIAGNCDIARALLLSQGLSAKTYGPGTVKTLSVRGHSASQTRLLWNGIPINSPTLGLSDLSNIPAIAADKAELRYGAAGGGAIGAELHLDIEPLDTLSSEAVLNQEYNGLHSYNMGLRVRAKSGPIGVGVRFYFQSAQNDYHYHNNSSASPPYPLEQRKNANMHMEGVIIESAIKPWAGTEIQAAFWDHYARRLIPTSLLSEELDSNERQNESARRFYLRLRQSLGSGILEAQVSHSNVEMDYLNQQAGIYSPFKTNSLNEYILYTIDLNPRHRLKLEQEFESVSASSLFYGSHNNAFTTTERNTLGLGASLFGKVLPKLGYFLMLHQSLMNNTLLPLTASAGLNLQHPASLPVDIRLNISRLHRIPSMNDLFWEPGGDPDLDAEQGYQGEFGIVYTRGKKVVFRFEANAFYSMVDGWIQWLPHPQYNYWTARNLRQVKNRGIETSVHLAFDGGSWTGQAKAAYTYTLSSTTKAAFEGDLSPGYQLIYTPKHSGVSTLWLQRGIFFAQLSTPFVGKRFTNIDNTRYMPAFITLDAGAGIRKRIKSHVLEIHLETHNLFNQDYQIIAWYPMPLRYYSIAVNLHFKAL
jgi:vitamin B12 transporter